MSENMFKKLEELYLEELILPVVTLIFSTPVLGRGKENAKGNSK